VLPRADKSFRIAPPRRSSLALEFRPGGIARYRFCTHRHATPRKVDMTTFVASMVDEDAVRTLVELTFYIEGE
jgi:hypothetical protein